MKHIALLAILATAALLPAAAEAAAPWSGVVVTTDAHRGTAVTASAGGLVRTVRLQLGAPRLRAGFRVTVSALPLADGTFALRGVRVTGRATRARVRGVVVGYQRTSARTLLSAGGSVFAFRSGSDRTTAAVSEPKPGDRIVADVTIKDGGSLVAAGVSTVGHAGVVELEGIFTKLDGAKLELAAVERGLVSVTVPAGVTLPALKPGDEITVIAEIGADGSFTLVSLDAKDGDGKGADLTGDGGEVEAQGTITSLAPLTVAPEEGSAVSCAVPAGVSLDGFAVGDSVELKCEVTPAGLVLATLESDTSSIGAGGGEHANPDPSAASDGEHGNHDGEND